MTEMTRGGDIYAHVPVLQGRLVFYSVLDRNPTPLEVMAQTEGWRLVQAYARGAPTYGTSFALTRHLPPPTDPLLFCPNGSECP